MRARMKPRFVSLFYSLSLSSHSHSLSQAGPGKKREIDSESDDQQKLTNKVRRKIASKHFSFPNDGNNFRTESSRVKPVRVGVEGRLLLRLAENRLVEGVARLRVGAAEEVGAVLPGLPRPPEGRGGSTNRGESEF